MTKVELKKLGMDFSVCKIKDISEVDFTKDFVFVSKTDDELSLVCPTKNMPSNTTVVESGWNTIKIQGELDFGLIGIIAEISNILAKNNISVFVVSTYNTDYILLKNENFNKAVKLLENNEYKFID